MKNQGQSNTSTDTSEEEEDAEKQEQSLGLTGFLAAAGASEDLKTKHRCSSTSWTTHKVPSAIRASLLGPFLPPSPRARPAEPLTADPLCLLCITGLVETKGPGQRPMLAPAQEGLSPLTPSAGSLV